MSLPSFKTDSLKIEVDTTELDAKQKRLIKKINTLLTHVMTTDEESDYFVSSGTLMKLVATAIKDANFSKYWNENANIAYSEQAIEYSIDSLTEDLGADTFVPLDN
ncbi:MAG: hypothetical protein N4A33_12820 [Bacteriovoracaceae bacterium]|jgi:hypothetical protein|nr:hypothetical protein [Bacteriovoracaceae bacterium]